MTKRESIRQQRLERLEAEFTSLLPRVLKECAAGRWGLFGQNDDSDGSRYIHWPEAEQLKEMAREIKAMRLDWGEPNKQVERFIHYCSLRGPNVPGEPKLARSLLAEFDSGANSRSQ